MRGFDRTLGLIACVLLLGFLGLQSCGGEGGGGSIHEPPPPPGDGIPMGVNIAWINYYASQWVFVNIMKQFAPWSARDASNPLQSPRSADDIPKDENGYPLEIPFDLPGFGPQIVSTGGLHMSGHAPVAAIRQVGVRLVDQSGGAVERTAAFIRRHVGLAEPAVAVSQEPVAAGFGV